MGVVGKQGVHPRQGRVHVGAEDPAGPLRLEILAGQHELAGSEAAADVCTVLGGPGLEVGFVIGRGLRRDDGEGGGAGVGDPGEWDLLHAGPQTLQ
jgi:hypothetical protein